MIDHESVDAMFEFAPGVGDLTEDTRAIEQLSVAARQLAHRIVDLVPHRPTRAAALRKLCDVVSEANAGIAREAQQLAARGRAA